MVMQNFVRGLVIQRVIVIASESEAI